MFYKKQDQDLVSASFIDGQGYTLAESCKDDYTYPVDGWYWFDNLEAAIEGMRGTPKTARDLAVTAIKVTTSSGKTFDGDETSQGRMTRAIVAMQLTNTLSITWILANNTPTEVLLGELIEALALAGAEQSRLWVLPYT